MTKGFSWAPLLTYLLRVLFGSHQILGFIGAWSKIDGIVLRSLHLRRGYVLSYTSDSRMMKFYLLIFHKRLKINDQCNLKRQLKYLTRFFFFSTFVKNTNSSKSAAFPTRILIGTVHQILYFIYTRIYGHLRWPFFSPFGYGKLLEVV